MFLSIAHLVGSMQESNILSVVCMVIAVLFLITGAVLLFSHQPLAAIVASGSAIVFVLLSYVFRPKETAKKIGAFFHKTFHGLFGKRLA